jgi:hypothetical protein
LHTQLLAAVPRYLIEELTDADSDFNSVPPLRIMQYLHELYGKITPAMLKANLAKLETPWNPTDPISALWKQFKDCADFANKGNETIQMSHAIHVALEILKASGVFPLDLHGWGKKPEAERADYNTL